MVDAMGVRKALKAFHEAFPQLAGSIIVVLEGDVPEQLGETIRRLADRFSLGKTVFQSVYTPRIGPFFDQNSLLYLSEQEPEHPGPCLPCNPFLPCSSNTAMKSSMKLSLIKKICQRRNKIQNELRSGAVEAMSSNRIIKEQKKKHAKT